MAVSTGIGGCSYTLGPPSGWSEAIYHSNVSPIRGWENAHCTLLVWTHRSTENNGASTTERWHRRLMRLQHSLTDPRKNRSGDFRRHWFCIFECIAATPLTPPKRDWSWFIWWWFSRTDCSALAITTQTEDPIHHPSVNCTSVTSVLILSSRHRNKNICDS